MYLEKNAQSYSKYLNSTLHTGLPEKVVQRIFSKSRNCMQLQKWKHLPHGTLLGSAVTTGYPNLQSPGPEGWLQPHNDGKTESGDGCVDELWCTARVDSLREPLS